MQVKNQIKILKQEETVGGQFETPREWSFQWIGVRDAFSGLQFVQIYFINSRQNIVKLKQKI